jgi:hypothetical protein
LVRVLRAGPHGSLPTKKCKTEAGSLASLACLLLPCIFSCSRADDNKKVRGRSNSLIIFSDSYISVWHNERSANEKNGRQKQQSHFACLTASASHYFSDNSNQAMNKWEAEAPDCFSSHFSSCMLEQYQPTKKWETEAASLPSLTWLLLLIIFSNAYI